MTRWERACKFFDLYKIGTIITRRKYLWVMGVKSNPTGYAAPPEDTYRLYLTRAGYLKHTGNGEYTLMKKIPPDLSMAECRKLAYPKKIKRCKCCYPPRRIENCKNVKGN